jgi:wyosine [tRNA(Phe)-imidazoG37] synthetase (radical SAM superfamily)
MSSIFGPVNSRRFGKSLGVDLSPNKKQCNFDCLYCELAPASTVDSYDSVVSVEEIMTQLKEYLSKESDIDLITITANGEPTLYPYLEELIDSINLLPYRPQTLILSNGSTIEDSSTQNALLKLDSVKLSLDCATNRCLKKLDRSHRDITIESIKSGMLKFRSRYKKPMIIEILFVKNINNKEGEIESLNNFLMELGADRVDIGTIDRPPAYDVGSLSYEELYQISMEFDPSLPIYITARKRVESKPTPYSSNEILQTISKRPLTDDDIDILFDKESQNRLKELIRDNKIVKKERNSIFFYILSQNS